MIEKLNSQISSLLSGQPQAGRDAPEYGASLAGRLRYATDMLLVTLDGLWDSDFYAESLREGWKLGEITALIARDADDRTDQLASARTGRSPKFDEERRWEPSKAYQRPGGVIIEDAIIALTRLRKELAHHPPETWAQSPLIQGIVQGRISAIEDFLSWLEVRTVQDAKSVHLRFV